MSWRHDRIGLRELVVAIWLAALTQVIAQPVQAEVRVSGHTDALKLEAREASVEEVLAALRASFKLQFHTSGAVNRVMTGTYTGSLRHVVARLFDGQNYVMRSSAGGIELIVFGPGGAGSSASASGRSVAADARQPELPAPTPSSDVQGWSGMAPVGPPRAPAVPIAKSTAGAVPRVSPPPRPESDPQTQQLNIQGWGG
jgi:hypothetical protein